MCVGSIKIPKRKIINLQQMKAIQIQKAKIKEELRKLWETMKEKAFLSYNVDIKKYGVNEEYKKLNRRFYGI